MTMAVEQTGVIPLPLYYTIAWPTHMQYSTLPWQCGRSEHHQYRLAFLVTVNRVLFTVCAMTPSS